MRAMLKKIIDCTIAILFVVVAVWLIEIGKVQDTMIVLPIVVIVFLCAVLHFVWALKPKQAWGHDDSYKTSNWPTTASVPTELVLLGEDDTQIATWNIYGKNGMVIGRDIGENQVSVDLNHVTYASMIDIEHAVLNYSGDSWYIEDVSEKNGISIEKMDGKKYKIAYGKPCKLERGDIIHIALTRLQIR